MRKLITQEVYMKTRIRKGIAFSLALLLSLTVLFPALSKRVIKTAEAANTSTFEDLSQDEIVVAMGAGWNLGNSMEASSNGVPSETAWNNPTITQGTFAAVKAAGFDTVRIPVSYLSYLQADSSAEYGYSVNDSWMARIKEVVDMAIAEDLYVIINVHGDGYNSVNGAWLLCNSSDQTTIVQKYKALWQDVANNFKDYDEHLIFESMNEEFDGTNYTTYIASYYDNIMTYNQAFVDVIRATGGNNAKRWLMVPGWNTNINCTVDEYFYPPVDSKNRIMISVHFYDPYFFSHDAGSNNQYVWPAGDEWATETYIKNQFKSMYSRYSVSGYPIVVGEFGCVDKSSSDSSNQASRELWTKTVVKYAATYGCVPVWWDNGDAFALINRSQNTVKDSNAQGIINAIKEGMTSKEEIVTQETQTLTWIGTASNYWTGSTGGGSKPSTTSSDFAVGEGFDTGIEIINPYGDVSKSANYIPTLIQDWDAVYVAITTSNGSPAYIELPWAGSEITCASGTNVNITSSILSAQCAEIFATQGDTITKVVFSNKPIVTKYTQTSKNSDGTWNCRFIKIMPVSDLLAADHATFTISYNDSPKIFTTRKYYQSINTNGNNFKAPWGYGLVVYEIANIPSNVSESDFTFDVVLE